MENTFRLADIKQEATSTDDDEDTEFAPFFPPPVDDKDILKVKIESDIAKIKQEAVDDVAASSSSAANRPAECPSKDSNGQLVPALRGPWMQVMPYGSQDPGLPGTLNTANVIKTDNGGVTVSWEANGTATEFAVFIAVKGDEGRNTPPFLMVYKGPNGSCHVSKDQLTNAVVDTSGGRPPAIIFRVIGKNERGFSPVSQICWLQKN